MLHHVEDEDAQILNNYKESSNPNDPVTLQFHETVKKIHSKAIKTLRDFKNNKRAFKTTISAIYGMIESMKQNGSYLQHCQITRESTRRRI